MMTTLLTLIRHGATEWNSKRVIMGQGPLPLSELGQRQAEMLVSAVEGIEPVDAVYCSDLLRCRQTIAPAADAMGYSVTLDARFRELDFGAWQGLTRDEVSRYAPEESAAWEADRLNYVIPGGESKAMMIARVQAGLRDIIAAHHGQHVLVTTHGGPIRALLPRLGACPDDDVPWIYNTSITTLAMTAPDSAERVLRLVNVDHLPEDMQPH